MDGGAWGLRRFMQSPPASQRMLTCSCCFSCSCSALARLPVWLAGWLACLAVCRLVG